MSLLYLVVDDDDDDKYEDFNCYKAIEVDKKEQ